MRIRRLLHEKLGFLELLQLFRHSECSDPRDKVYSLLGLAPESVRLQMNPDHKKAPIKVYSDVTRWALERPAPDLEFLGYTMRLDSPRRQLSTEISHATWPFWIPNWDDPLLFWPIPKALYMRDTTQDRSFVMFNPHMYNARTIRPTFGLQKAYSASCNFPVEASISNYQLSITGVLVDTIVDLFTYSTMTVDQINAKCRSWSTMLNQKYPTGETFGSALARVQVADIRYDQQGYPISRNNACDNALLRKPRTELLSDEYIAQTSMRIALRNASSYRGTCLTSQGYLGLIPMSAREGDRICVLLGGQVLYVLRPKDLARPGTTYEYIGECYVHGLMDGEVMSWVQEGRATTERFVLV